MHLRVRHLPVLSWCSPGDTVAIVGAGPIGLAAVVTARLFSSAHIVVVDQAESRLQAAKVFGADTSVLATSGDPLEAVRSLTGGLGADVVIEAVGTPQTFELHHPGAARRPGRQRRRARQARHAAPRPDPVPKPSASAAP